jgi:hypothetical protein
MKKMNGDIRPIFRVAPESRHGRKIFAGARLPLERETQEQD